MDLRTFIFSDINAVRVQRHVLFWAVWLALTFLTSSIGVMHVEGLRRIILLDFLATIQRTWLVLPFCYFVIYFLVERFFLCGRIRTGVILMLIGIVLCYFAMYVNARITSPYIGAIVGRDPIPEAKAEYYARVFSFTDIIMFTDPLVCCAVIGSIRFLKVWYIKQQQNQTLVRENAVAELQLLKSQVHPHFLFNTLNNIYSFTLVKSPMAVELLEKLTGILQYMIIEGQMPLVPLKKEIALILDYISLEKVRYGSRLDITVAIKGDSTDKDIPPLLMIPFVENSFKHGSSQMLKHPIVNLSIVIADNKLFFDLTNNKPTDESRPVSVKNKGGIGLKNVEERLKLLFPNRHTLKIESGSTTFTVKMTLTLSEPEREFNKSILLEQYINPMPVYAKP